MGIKLANGRVVDPASGIDEKADVYVQGHTVAGVGRKPAGFKLVREIDVDGLVVAPGLVDLGSRLREPGFEHKATIASEARAAACAGFTTLCCTPDTHPVLDNPAVVQHINQRAQTARGAQIKCLGALTVNLDGETLAEMHALKAAGCVGVTNLDHAIKDTAVLKHALAYAASANLTVFLHSEDYWLGRQGTMHEGATSTRLGIPGIPSAAEVIGLHRDLTLVANTGVRAHFCRISSAAALAPLMAARRAGLSITADTGILNLSFTAEDAGEFDANFHVRPPLRERSDRKALGLALTRGSLDAISTCHEPHDADAKAAPFALSEAGASTLDTFLPALLVLVDSRVLNLSDAIDCTSTQPNRILGLAGGTLKVGAPADLCVFDPQHKWVVAEDRLRSRGKNNPWLGRALRGKNLLTIIAGNVVFEDLKSR